MVLFTSCVNNFTCLRRFLFSYSFLFHFFSFLGVVLCTILLSFPYNVTLLFSVVFFCINTTIAQYCFLVFLFSFVFFCFAVLLNTKNIPTVILICLVFLFVFYAFPVYFFFFSVCESLRVSECLLAKNKRVDLVECGRASVFVCLCVLRKSNAKLVCCLLARARGFRLVFKKDKNFD